MKKLFVFMLAIVLVVAFTVPASALTNKFGGYWRTRFYSYDSLNGLDTGAKTIQSIDTRTRLFYTAVLHDNLKFVNEFEFDAVWGGAGTYGAPGADAVAFEIRRSYLDFNLANLRWAIGTQGFTDATTGFMYDDEATGMKIEYRADNTIASFRWFMMNEGGTSNNGEDYDVFDFIWNQKFGNQSIAPFVQYWFTNDGGSGIDGMGVAGQEQKIYFIGATYQFKGDAFSMLASAAYEGGDLNDTMDVTAYMFNFDGKYKMNAFTFLGRFFYVSGNDDTSGTSTEGWYAPGPPMQSYTWSEMYGKGAIDKSLPDNSYGKTVTNMMNFGLGLDYTINKAWSAGFTWWNINYAQDGAGSGAVKIDGTAATDKSIGNELDFRATWKVMKALTLKSYFSYLIMGDGYEPTTNSQDPWELAAQLEIKF